MAGAGVGSAQAAIYDLGFVLDESGSIGSTNFGKAQDALAAALDQLPISGSDTYRVGVVTFGVSATTVVLPTLINSQSALDSVKSAITGYSYQGGLTNLAAGINLINSIFQNLADPLGAKSLINISTDGQPNEPGTTANARQQAADAAQTAVNQGWDSISVEAIGGGVDTTYLLDNIVHPTPGVLVQSGGTIPDPLQSGFVIEVADFDAYGDAIAAKVQKITTSVVPVPAAFPLMLSGLGALGLLGLRRRRKSPGSAAAAMA